MTQAADQTLAHGIDSDGLRRYADLVLRSGVNLEAGQKILITGDVQHAYLIAALAERAYANGASAAETLYFDDRVLAAKAAGAPTDALAASVPAWYEAAYQTVIDERWARIRTLGDPIDDPYAGVPVARATALQTAVTLPAYRTIEARTNWNLCPCPTPAWARRIYGEPDVARLWRDLRYAVRLDEADPVAAWRARHDELSLRAAHLDEAGFVALRLRGGGTDLFVPLHGDARWQPAWLTTSWGREFLCNLPSEEIYVAPDFRGVQGTAVATRPVTVNGVLVTGLSLRFVDGLIVEVTADTNADVVRASLDTLLDALGVRDMRSFNKKAKKERVQRLPYIVIVIDEFADLMATTGKELESTLARLAAMARAVGIHMVLATQRPSIDVITGLIKANIPRGSRSWWRTSSTHGSSSTGSGRKLLGKGDICFQPHGIRSPYASRAPTSMMRRSTRSRST